jgi:benzoyl-CoA reductase/2-hydroxyglutaryl-CoA dehydratase subunit BcrC/BadD/HgdB
VDLPYHRNERGYEYIADQLRTLVTFLEEKTGRKLEYERLRQVMEYSNAAHEYALKLAEMRRAVPCPYSSLDNLAEYPLVLCLAGTPQLVDYYKMRYERTREMVERGEGYLSKEQEKIRMAWIYGAPAFDLFLFMTLEQKYGAVAVANMNNNFVMQPVSDLSSTDAILRGLAEKITLLPMTRECGGPWENYLDASIDLCRRYKADCAVFAGHVACKANWAVIKLVKDKMTEELGIPIMIIELDLFDPRILSSNALSGQFDEFFEVFLKDRLGQGPG